MRAIKFRGMRKDTKEWVYGYYIKVVDVHTIMAPSENSIDWYKVIPKTVGQFTGIEDKNGTEIYKGDIAAYYVCHTHQKPTLGYVDYDESVGQWRLITTGGGESGFPQIDFGDFEVIGNIHDNPELLEEAD